jgi:hypothetical protein
MAILGLRGSGDWTAGEERPKNFRESILWLHPNGQAPLLALTSKMKSQKVDDPEFNWWEESLGAMRATLAAQVGNTTTANTLSLSTALTDSFNFVAGDVLMQESTTVDPASAELLVVASDPSASNILTVTRAALGSTVATLATSTVLVRIGNAFREGTTSPSASARSPTKLFNYTQIFKTAYDLSRTAKGTYTRTGDPLAVERKRRMSDHAVSMELAFLFGRRLETTTGASTGRPLRYTGGLRSFISTNATVWNTTATEDTFMTFMENMFDFSSGAGNERMILCGGGFARRMNLLLKTQMDINTDNIVKVYGMNLQQYVTPVGTFYLKTHPLMNTIAGLDSSAFIIDPTGIKYRPFMDTKHEDNIQANDADETKGQWITEAGIEVNHEKTMGFIHGFKY